MLWNNSWRILGNKRLKMLKRNLITILLFVCGIVNVYAQSDAKAKAILADVSKKFRSYDVVKADFDLLFVNQQMKTKESQTGTLYVKSKLNKFKAILPSQDLISDGKNQWVYLKHDKEVQLSELDNSPNALNPAQIFTMYEKGFKYVYTGEVKSNGRIYQNIELAPLTTQTFSKIKLKIDKQNKQISSFVVYDKNGNIYTYTIKTFTPNVKVSDMLFTFETAKHPGVELVDLR
jgi:outer membrane lipoprotein-sorting protein